MSDYTNLSAAQPGYSAIEFAYDRGVGVIRLNSPDRLNSFTTAMREELVRAVAYLSLIHI